ncbi:MAG: thioredoxin [Gemmatimonas sp. SG8_38_2]|nr:MAG: thioredoxin [Gemmatimonas sp. SG8_38_2]
MTVLTLNSEADLEQVLSENDTVIIDFWADWCPPCREFAPLFERAAQSHPELAFCRVNSDEVKPLARAFGVQTIPTLYVVRERILIAEQPGYMAESALDDLLKKATALNMDEVRREVESSDGESEDQI